MRARTVVLHERIERPPLAIVVLSMLVGPAKRPGFEVSSVTEFRIIHNLRSPLPNEGQVDQDVRAIEGKGRGTRTPLTLKSYPQTSQAGAR
jgi:hypothetical protein